MKTWNELGIQVPEVYLPAERDNLRAWSVIACDQYTSDPNYWQRVDDAVGSSPSTLRMVLPEVHLNSDKQQALSQNAVQTMQAYLDNGVVERIAPGFVLVRRSFAGKPGVRTGLVVSLDLERYDYHAGSQSLIRASEGTIEERLPARMVIRRQAQLELPHIMVLIDDKQQTVIEPLAAQTASFTPLYDSELGFNMGHIQGYHVPADKAEDARAALSSLLETLEARGQSGEPMLYAMGDGNHSFAAAKAFWEELKHTLPEAERETHPARYALCELVNIHDSGLAFEPIHRLFIHAGNDGLSMLQQAFGELGSKATLAAAPQDGVLSIRYATAEGEGYLLVQDPPHMLAQGAIDMAIAKVLERLPQAEVDYIHGDDETRELGAKPGNVGLLLPPFYKEMVFSYVEQHGALPRKSFSMGEADEKRCYLECRKITK